MTRVFCAARLFGAMSIAAALDAGLFGERHERRLLITADTSAVPEIADRFDESAAFDALRSRFDDVVHWNDVIAPMHPFAFEPPEAEVPMLSRLIADRLGLRGERVDELVVESVAVAPAKTFGTLIPDCPVTVYSDGLMSYGPTRDELSTHIGRRVSRLLHLDLVPGLTPLLLRDYDVTPHATAGSEFAKIIGELPAPAPDEDVSGWPVVVGQYLSALDILTADEEIGLYAGLMQGLRARGHDGVVFAPHPAAGASHVPALRRVAERLGVRLVIAGGAGGAGDGLPIESWFAAYRPELVVSPFSTALFTAQRWFGLPTACAGTELLLERLSPYQNSNRIPVTIVDATVPRLRPDGRLVEPGAVDVEQLVRAVGYCMQAARNSDLRPAAERYLREHGPQRYFKHRRLESLGLLGAPTHPVVPVRRAAGAVLRAAATTRTAVRPAPRRTGR